MAQSDGQFAQRDPMGCSVECLLEWIVFATSLLDSTKRANPGGLAVVQNFHAELLKRISRLTDGEAERLEPRFTEFEEKLQRVCR